MPPSSPLVVFSPPPHRQRRPTPKHPSTPPRTSPSCDSARHSPPQLLVEPGNITGNTIRDGGTQNQAADAPEQRGVAPYDASWITSPSSSVSAPTRSQGMRADAGAAGTVAQITEDSR